MHKKSLTKIRKQCIINKKVFIRILKGGQNHEKERFKIRIYNINIIVAIIDAGRGIYLVCE